MTPTQLYNNYLPNWWDDISQELFGERIHSVLRHSCNIENAPHFLTTREQDRRILAKINYK